jgi:hypothetical protein
MTQRLNDMRDGNVVEGGESPMDCRALRARNDGGCRALVRRESQCVPADEMFYALALIS